MPDNETLPLAGEQKREEPAPAVFPYNRWLYSKKHPEGKLFLEGEPYPPAKEGFVDTPAKL